MTVLRMKHSTIYIANSQSVPWLQYMPFYSICLIAYILYNICYHTYKVKINILSYPIHSYPDYQNKHLTNHLHNYGR